MLQAKSTLKSLLRYVYEGNVCAQEIGVNKFWREKERVTERKGDPAATSDATHHSMITVQDVVWISTLVGLG